jgi:hypothetical protein
MGTGHGGPGPAGEKMRIVADRLAACGLEVRPSPVGEYPPLLSVTHPVTADSAEVEFSDDGPAIWQVFGSAGEDTGPGAIAGEIIRLLCGATAGGGERPGDLSRRGAGPGTGVRHHASVRERRPCHARAGEGSDLRPRPA